MNEKTDIFVVGKIFDAILNTIDRENYQIGAFIDEKQLKSMPAGVAPIYKLPFADKVALVEALQALCADGEKFKKPAALFSFYENSIIPQAQIGSALGIRTISEAAAMAATDKYLMRKCFAAYDKTITPQSTLVANEAILIEFSEANTFPLILKPANLVKSLMVKKCDSLPELLEHYRHMVASIAETYKRESVSLKPAIIVEEFMVGTFHSVDAIIDEHGTATFLPIVDLIMANELGIDDNHNYKRLLPSELASKKQKEITAVAQKGITALGLTNMPAHVEVVATAAGVKIIEIGARMGGYRSRMHKLANNIEYTQSLCKSLLDQEYDLTGSSNNYCAVYELFPKETGQFLNINNLEEVRNLASTYYHSVKAKAGETVGLARNGYRGCAVLILTNNDQQQFLSDCRFVESHVKVNIA